MIMIFLGLTFHIFANIISDIGFGDSQEEARQSALLNIASNVSGLELRSVTEIKTFESEEVSYSSFSEEITAKSRSYLVGPIKYEDEITSSFETVQGKWKSRAIIDESAIPNVISRINELCINLEELWKKYESSIDENQSKRYLGYYLDNRLKYDGLKAQAYSLGVSNICHPKDVASYDLALIEYEDLARKDWNNNNSIYYELKRQNDTAKILDFEQKIQQDLIEQRQLEDIKKHNEEAESLKNQQRVKEVIALLTKPSAVEEGTLSYAEDGVKEAERLFSAVISSGLAFKHLADGYERLVSDETERLSKDFDDRLDAIRNKAFLFTELTSDGSPLESAKEYREYEIKKMKVKKQEELDWMVDSITRGMASNINSAYNDYRNRIDDLQSKKFPISSFDSIKVTYLGYEARKTAWILGLEVSVSGNRLLRREFLLPYADVVGEEPSNEQGTQSYEKYLDNVDIYTVLLQDFHTYFKLESSYSVIFNIETSEYLIKLDSVIDVINREDPNISSFDISDYRPEWHYLKDLGLSLLDYHFLNLTHKFNVSGKAQDELTHQRIDNFTKGLFSYLWNEISIAYYLTVGYNFSLDETSVLSVPQTDDELDFPGVLLFRLGLFKEYDNFALGLDVNGGWDPNKYYRGVSLGVAGEILGFLDVGVEKARIYLGVFGGLSKNLMKETMGDFGVISLVTLNMGSSLPEDIVKGSGLSIGIHYNLVKNAISLSFGVGAFGLRSN